MKNIKVLLAEDDFLVSEEILRILKKTDYEVVGTASNGVQAAEMTCSLKPDVVLMDIKMPKVDGLKATYIIQQSCPTPVVVLTAHESQKLVNKASEMGVSAYLVKPPKSVEIERAITIAIARHNDLMKLHYTNKILSREIIERKQAEKEIERLVEELHVEKDTIEEHAFNLQKLNEKLLESEKSLQEINSSKDKFFSIIAHDLRSPFAGFLGLTDFLAQEYKNLSPQEISRMVETMNHSAKRLSNLLENLLLWSRSQTGRMEFNQIEIDLNTIIENNILLMQRAAGNKKITITKLLPERVVIYADEEMINTVIRNLLSNAIKFSHIEGKIEIGSKSLSNNEIQIYIADSGVGISKKNTLKLFSISQTYTTRGTDNEKGSGLGLIICKEFIEKHGRRIWVESKIGKGSQFNFTIPYYIKNEDTLPTEEESSLTKPEHRIKDKTILIVEDDESSDIFLTKILSRKCKKIVHAKTGIEAIELCRSDPDINIVLMDIRMYKMNGYEATQKIRKFNKNLVIIAQTTLAMEGEREKSLEAGCDDYITKPIDKDALIEMIKKHLK